MSRFFFSLPKVSFILFLLTLIALMSQAGCTEAQQSAVNNATTNINAALDTTLETPKELVFAGQVETDDGEWQNEYVVVLFKNEEEIARTHTTMQDAHLSGKGPMDGVFELRIPNEYELTQNHNFFDINRNSVAMMPVIGTIGTQYLGIWYENLTPMDIRVVAIPDKQLRYSLAVLEHPLNDPLVSFEEDKLRLEFTDNNNSARIFALNDESNIEEETAVPTATPQPAVELTIMPNANIGITWNVRLSGFFGNRWQVWEQFVAGRVPGLSWEQFKEIVLVYNPHLEADGFVFYPEKSYMLPQIQ